jgi:hypothetical protein
MFRYTFPEAVITNRSTGVTDRRAEYGHAFSLGLRWDAGTSDYSNPAVGHYLARLAAIRNQHASILLEGRFVDNELFQCDNAAISAHAFAAGKRLAVVLWNPTGMPQRAEVAAPRYHLESVVWQDPEDSGPDHALLPNDVAVFVFREGN